MVAITLRQEDTLNLRNSTTLVPQGHGEKAVLEDFEILPTTGAKGERDSLHMAVENDMVAFLDIRDKVVDLHPLIQEPLHLVALLPPIAQSTVLQNLVVRNAWKLKASQVNIQNSHQWKQLPRKMKKYVPHSQSSCTTLDKLKLLQSQIVKVVKKSIIRKGLSMQALQTIHCTSVVPC